MAADPELVKATSQIARVVGGYVVVAALIAGAIAIVLLFIRRNLESLYAKLFRRQPKYKSSNHTGQCPRCGGTLVQRNGKFGPFLGCNNYPRCKFTKPI